MNDKIMQGALFLNDKDGNEARPDFRGKILLDDGRLLKVSAWKNVSKEGKPYLSCKCDWSDEVANTAEVKDAWAGVLGSTTGTATQPTAIQVEPAVAIDDNIPF